MQGYENIIMCTYKIKTPTNASAFRGNHYMGTRRQPAPEPKLGQKLCRFSTKNIAVK